MSLIFINRPIQFLRASSENLQALRWYLKLFSVSLAWVFYLQVLKYKKTQKYMLMLFQNFFQWNYKQVDKLTLCSYRFFSTTTFYRNGMWGVMAMVKLSVLPLENHWAARGRIMDYLLWINTILIKK